MADYTQFGVSMSLSAELCVDAVDVINPAATSARYDGSLASIESGRVRESSDLYPEHFEQPWSFPDWTLKWTWAGPSGLYLVDVTGKAAAGFGTPTSSSQVWALFRVNGKVVTQIGNPGNPGGSTAEFTWQEFKGFGADGFQYNIDHHYAYPWVPLAAGDEVEVMIISAIEATSTFTFIPFDVRKICFTADENAPASVYCTGTWDCDDHPVGDVWGSPMGWGGQILVPEGILTDVDPDIIPYDESNFPWGIDWVDYDFVALEDGTLYAIFHDASVNVAGDTIPPAGALERHWLVVKKYDPGSDTWTELSHAGKSFGGHTYWNEHSPETRYKLEAVTCEIGGDGKIYFIWWEQKTTTSGTPNPEQWAWHVVRLDPSDDSTTELGTGQWKNTVGPAPYYINYSGSVLVPGIVAMPNGNVYVSTVEYKDSSPSFPSKRHVYVWKWDGASWTNIDPPAPSDLGTSGDDWTCDGENSFYDQPTVMVAARPSGPVTNGFTLHYPYKHTGTADGFSHELRMGVTIQYTEGIGWHDEVLSDWDTLLYDVQGNWPQTGDGTPWVQKSHIPLDVSLLWSEKLGRLVICADLVGGGSGEAWVMMKMNAAGTQWEPIEDSPPSVAGDWRQGRNTADIGPDGEVYRGMFSEWNTDILFLPRITKHATGYGPGWSNALRNEIGQVTNKDFPWGASMYSSTNTRIRIVGNKAYLMCNVYVESAGWFYGEEEWADAIMIFSFTWNPCVSFRPHFYRRILG